MMIRETIHHGNYRNVRVVELDPKDRVAVADLINSCHYLSTRATDNGPVVRRVASALESGGSYDYGWVCWEVVR